MPKKKHNETLEDQSARFRAEVERMIEAGELSPTDADKALDGLVRMAAHSASPGSPAKTLAKVSDKDSSEAGTGN